jgi:hypothetical protein
MPITLTEALEDPRIQRLTRRQRRLKVSVRKLAKVKAVGTQISMQNGETDIEFTIRKEPENNTLTGVVYDFVQDLTDELNLQIQNLETQIGELVTDLTT